MKGLMIAVAALGATPALAADVTTINCVQWRATAATRTALLADIRRNLQLPAGGQHIYSTAAQTGLQAAAATCQRQHGWSDAARTAAIMHAMATMGEPVAREVARQVGLDYELLSARVAALSAGELQNGTTGTALRTVAEGAEAAKEINDKTARPAGAIYALLLIVASSLATFARG